MEHNHLTIILGIIVIFSRCILLYTASCMQYVTRKSYLSSVVICLLSARGRRIDMMISLGDNMECPLENFILVSATCGALTHTIILKKETSKLMKQELSTT